MLSITKRFTFEAAHRLFLPDLSEKENLSIFGPCFYIHGHSYKLEVSLKGETDRHGWLINFSEFKEKVNKLVISSYDHSFLNELEDYKDRLPTAENMARTIFFKLKEKLKADNFQLFKVTIYETENSWASFEEDYA